MVFQTSYGLRPAEALAGMAADSMIAKDDISRVNEAAAGIYFGQAVVRGTGDKLAKLPASINDVFLGVALRDYSQNNAGIDQDIPVGAQFSVRRLGRIWVITEEATVEGGAAFYRIAAQGLLTTLGAWRTTDDATTAASTVRHANARWAKSHASGIGCLELLGPQTQAVAVAQT